MADAAELAVGFAAALRAAGVSVGTAAVTDFADALGLVGVGRRSGVYHAGAATLVRRVEDLAAFDAAFASYWDGLLPLPSPVAVAPTPAPMPEGSGRPAAGLRWSAAERLADRDLAALDAGEWVEAQRVIDAMRVAAATRPSRRLGPAEGHGRVDLRTTLRRSARSDGLALDWARRRPGRKPRKLVVLVDVSGSMDTYARACVRFAHAAVASQRAGTVEVFALGTRLTRLTRCLARRDPDAALAAAAAAVADWSGGTRLGQGLAEFNRQWGVRGAARGAVVVVVSDGWDRGDPGLLGSEMGRLHRVAHRVVWVNPLKASPGYAPLAAGMAAALPHVDRFVEGHSLASLIDLAAVVGGRR